MQGWILEVQSATSCTTEFAPQLNVHGVHTVCSRDKYYFSSRTAANAQRVSNYSSRAPSSLYKTLS
jgi:hypothetical protein